MKQIPIWHIERSAREMKQIKEEDLTLEYLLVNNKLKNHPLSELFDVHNEEMEKNIGKRVIFKNPTCEYQRECDGQIFITGIQKDYKGEIVYRVCAEHEKYQFGCPAALDEVEVID